MDEESKPRWNEMYRKKGVEVGVDKDEFIVAVNEEKAYALAPIVYYIWSHCDGETSIGHIVEDIMTNVEGLDIDTVYNAVIDIVDRLIEAELLEKV
ncbi:MAG: PqqD family protein [Ignisphaera sp.]|uniref:PqqD family protein n=1 Tax=Ignisphaera aggregans TaxID=334771 RepID=A0A7J3MXJ0_9CREN